MNSGGTRGKKPNALSCLICPWRSFPAATQQHITASHHLGDLVTWLWGACVHEITGLPPCLSRDWDVARGYCSVFLSRKRVSVPQSCSAFSPFPPVWFFMQLVMTASYWQLCLFFYFFSFSTLCPLIKNSYSLQGEEALLSARWQTQTQVLNREQGKYYSRPQRPMKIWTLQKSCLKLNICSDAECLFLWLLKRKSKAFARRNYIMFSPLLCS